MLHNLQSYIVPNIVIDTQYLTENDQLRLRVLNVKERVQRLGVNQIKPLYQYRFGADNIIAFNNTMSVRSPNQKIVERVEVLVQEMETGAVKKAVNNLEASVFTFGREAQEAEKTKWLKRKVSDLKKLQGLQVKDVANAMGVRPNYLSRAINGHVPVNNRLVEKFQEAFQKEVT